MKNDLILSANFKKFAQEMKGNGMSGNGINGNGFSFDNLDLNLEYDLQLIQSV